MDILTIIQTVIRRWYIAVPIMVVALVAALVVNTTIPAQYEARGQILLASPELDPSRLPRTIADLRELVGELSTDATQASLVVGNSTMEANATAETMSLIVDSGSPADAQATTSRVIDWLEEQIDARQEAANIDPVDRLQIQTDFGNAANEPFSTDSSGLDGNVSEDGSEVRTIVRLIDPADTAINPFGASNATARVLTVSAQSDAGQQAFAERAAPGVSFTLEQDVRDAAPILTVTTRGPDPDAVLEAFEHASAVVARDLADREERADVPETRRTTIETLADPLAAVDVSPPLERSVAAIIGLGGLLAVTLAIVADNILGRREQRPSATSRARWRHLARGGSADQDAPDTVSVGHDLSGRPGSEAR